MYITAISDTHTHHDELSLLGGDILIHAGDATYRGTLKEFRRFIEWFSQQSYRYKIFVAGNHDWGLEGTKMGEIVKQKVEQEMKDAGIIYLRNSSIEIEGINIYGCPETPYFGGWAFNKRGSAIKKYWDEIPENTDILVTHGPPEGILSRTNFGDDAGCPFLLERVRNLPNLKYHIFGHIHEGRGTLNFKGISFINASFCGIPYKNFGDAFDFEYNEKRGETQGVSHEE